MKFSEAIRLGAMLHPQRFGSWFAYRDARGHWCRASADGATIAATCALAAAQVAGYPDAFGPTLLATMEAMSRCPVCLYTASLRGVIAHLNDRHRWTRERIADWVEQQERATADRGEACALTAQETMR